MLPTAEQDERLEKASCQTSGRKTVTGEMHLKLKWEAGDQPRSYIQQKENERRNFKSE